MNIQEQTPPATGSPTEPLSFELGEGLTRAFRTVPYERKPTDPVARPLRIYTGDPGESSLAAAVAVVQIPFEPLEPGPRGALLEVMAESPLQSAHEPAPVPFDLSDPMLLLTQGCSPSPTDRRFAAQMVYAVCSLTYAAFRRALGRDLSWGFDRNGYRWPTDERGDGPLQLRLRPFAGEIRNAFYDPARGELCFGYFSATAAPGGRNLPNGLISTALSHDIVSHEMAHALLHGLRPCFNIPTNPDVAAFHEGFADLVAVFQHFAYRDVVQRAIAESRGRVAADRLTEIARQFGHTATSQRQALRTALAPSEKVYTAEAEAHELGSVLVSAVFDAFNVVYQRKVRRFIRLATAGSGVLPEGELAPALVEVLAEQAAALASQFLNICIRAIDYCPPVDIELGEYLRALLTADHDVLPDDSRWAYREAIVDAFRARRIFPRDVPTLSEDALLWRPPRIEIPPIQRLTFAELYFEGEPGRPMSPKEIEQQAAALGKAISDPACLHAFGLAPPAQHKPGEVIHQPTIESIRTSRRAGPDGQILFDLVAEVTQRRTIEHDGRELDFWGGATILIDPYGRVRLVVLKRIDDDKRLVRQLAYIASPAGRKHWVEEHKRLVPKSDALFRNLHDDEARMGAAEHGLEDRGERDRGGER